MADPIRGFFESQIGPDAEPVYTVLQDEERRRLQVAACALLLELAHADDEFKDSERAHIDAIIRREFGLNEDGANQLIALSEAERKQGTHLHVFADLIATRLDANHKRQLVEMMWRLALSDGEIAQHESWMMERVSDLLGLSRDDLTQARSRVSPKL